jgi:hypothetical protein
MGSLPLAGATPAASQRPLGPRGSSRWSAPRVPSRRGLPSAGISRCPLSGGGAQMRTLYRIKFIRREDEGRARGRGRGRRTTISVSRINETKTHTNRLKRHNRPWLHILLIDTALAGTEGRG